jgi:DNA-binding transcriptional ArsR family regulator
MPEAKTSNRFEHYATFISFLLQSPYMEEEIREESTEKVLILPLSEQSRQITQTLSNEKTLKILELLAQESMSATAIAEALDLPLTTVKYNLDSLMEADLIRVKNTRWSRKGREIKIYEPVQKMIVVLPGSKKPDRSSVLAMLKKYLALAAGAVFAAAGIESLHGFTSAPDALDQRGINEAIPEGGGALNPNDSNMLVTEALDKGGGNLSGQFGGAGYEAPLEAGDAFPVAPAESMPSGADGSGFFNGINSAVTDAPPDGGVASVNSSVMDTVTDDVSRNASSLSAPDSLPDVTTHMPMDWLSHVSFWFLLGCLSVLTILALWEIYKWKKGVDEQR